MEKNLPDSYHAAVMARPKFIMPGQTQAPTPNEKEAKAFTRLCSMYRSQDKSEAWIANHLKDHPGNPNRVVPAQESGSAAPAASPAPAKPAPQAHKPSGKVTPPVTLPVGSDTNAAGSSEEKTEIKVEETKAQAVATPTPGPKLTDADIPAEIRDEMAEWNDPESTKEDE